ncbi:MAG TPA: endo-1,4-beta-xylanase, partial [Blastocatellia bacterium]|nr:endo-1,4-beta-xylanase [Blastocatellia bacterium]
MLRPIAKLSAAIATSALRIFAAFVLVCLTCSLLLSPHQAGAQTGLVVQNDFEDGTLQGWIPRGGGVVLTNTTEVAHSGTHSLKTTGRTQGFHGPSLNVINLLTKGATYQVSAAVRLVTGTPATTIRVTVQRTPPGSSAQFDSVAQNTNVTDSAWVTLTGLYSFGTDVSGLLLYVESTSATASYYLDDFSITLLAPPAGPPPNTTGASADFETGTAQGWFPRIGSEVLTVTSADQHSGTFSLLTTNRTATFTGPAFDVTNVMFNGSQYRVSLWAKLAPGEASTQLRVSLQRNIGTTTTFHTVVGNTTVTANQWVNLKINYNVALANQKLTLYVESATGTPSFYIDDFTITFIPPAIAERNIPSVFQSLSGFFPVGAAVTPLEITGEHAFLLSKHFNSITSGNDMKWSSTEPTEGNFNFSNADAQVSFAKANGMQIRGHTLVWHNQIPAWVFNDLNGNPMTPTPENKALLLQRLQNHIQAELTHFGTDVYAWDVVNEVIDPSQPDGFRRSPWFNIIGPDYIDTAFRLAHQYAPAAKLYINDFSTTDPVKRQFLFNLISGLKSRGVPIDGIGHQMHNNIDFPSEQAIIDTINMFSSLGIDNQITELDVSIYSGSQTTNYNDYTLIPQDIFVRQAYRYRSFFDAFRQLKGKISSVTIWGLADDNSWLTSATQVNGPLLFDTSLQHKLAYTAILDPSNLPGADVAAVSTVGSNTVLSGNDIPYTLNVSDITHDPASGVTLTVPLPANTVFESLAAPGDWSTTTPPAGSGGTVICSVPTLAAGASATFTLVLRVNCDVPDGTTITTASTVTAMTPDPWTPNNSASSAVIVSNPAPSITAPSNLTLQCVGQVPPANPSDAIVSDNCGTPAVSVKDSSNGGAGSPASPLIITRTFTAVDSAGNSSSASQTITVSDTIPPVISCPANITLAGNIPGSCGALLPVPPPAAIDNCSGAVTPAGARSDALSLSAAYPLGVTSITWTATDAAGNSSSCVQTITVTNPNPVVTIATPVAGAFFPAGTPINFTGLFTDNPGGTHSAEWQFGNVTQAGALNEATGAISTTFAFAVPGIYTVQLSVNDGCGGQGSANT